MPTAPIYGGQKVNEGTMPGVRANTNASAADYGGAVAQGVSQLGEGTQQLAGGLANREALIARAQASEAKAKAEELSLRYNAALTADRTRIEAAYVSNPSEGIKQWSEAQKNRRKEFEGQTGGDPLTTALFSEDVVKHEYAQNGQADSFFIKKQLDREDEIAAASIASDTEKAGVFLASGDAISANLYFSGAEKNIRARGALLNEPPAKVDAQIQEVRGGATLSAIKHAAATDNLEVMYRLATDPAMVNGMSLKQRTEAANIINNVAQPKRLALAGESVIRITGGDMRLAVVAAERVAKETGIPASEIIGKVNGIFSEQEKLRLASSQQARELVRGFVAEGRTFDQYRQSNPSATPRQLAEIQGFFREEQEAASRSVDATKPETLRILSQLAINSPESIPAFLEQNARFVSLPHRKEFMDIANNPTGEGARRASEIDKLTRSAIDRLALADNTKYGMKGGVPIDAAAYNRSYQAIHNEVARSYADPKREVDPAKWAAWYQNEGWLHKTDQSVIEGLQPIMPDPTSPVIRGAAVAFAGNDEDAMRRGYAVALSMVKTASQFGEMDSPRYYASWGQMGVSEAKIKANRAAHVGMDPAEADALLAAEIPAQWEAENPGWVRQSAGWISEKFNASAGYIAGSWNKLGALENQIPGVSATKDRLAEAGGDLLRGLGNAPGDLLRGLSDAALQLSQPGFQIPTKTVDK